MADWQDSLFDEEKTDSLGDGTWGRRTTDEPKLAPVDWSALEGSAEEAKKKPPVRTRLATPAPGSQKGSGLLDIRALAAEMQQQREKAEPAAPPKKHSTGEVKTARLATAAKVSTGSGLINVADIVRQQEEDEAQAKASASSSAHGRVDDVELSPSSAAAASSSFAVRMGDASAASQSAPIAVGAPAGHSPMLLAVLGLLTVAVVGLAIYVLTAS